jgi:hypothetical protein
LLLELRLPRLLRGRAKAHALVHALGGWDIHVLLLISLLLLLLLALVNRLLYCLAVDAVLNLLPLAFSSFNRAD